MGWHYNASYKIHKIRISKKKQKRETDKWYFNLTTTKKRLSSKNHSIKQTTHLFPLTLIGVMSIILFNTFNIKLQKSPQNSKKIIKD